MISGSTDSGTGQEDVWLRTWYLLTPYGTITLIKKEYAILGSNPSTSASSIT